MLQSLVWPTSMDFPSKKWGNECLVEDFLVGKSSYEEILFRIKYIYFYIVTFINKNASLI